ncbi:MAG: hypothetical protein JNM99_22195 [Verrucomicrobiaceae bacterium]|nr:hypothetical protein [Verrucomicrobiaceae bacterium]
MRTIFFLIFSLTSSITASDLVHEDFSGPALPKSWTPGGRPGSWSVVDGALQGDCNPTDDHGPSISTPLPATNVSVSFKLRREPGSYALMLIDGDSAFGGQAHLLRVAVSGDRLTIAQDRGSLASKMEQAKAKASAKKTGQPMPKPTPEQLADPAFYRTESLAIAKLTTPPQEWLALKVIAHGNDVTVTINDGQVIKAKATVLDVSKSKLVFLAGAGKKLWIDDVQARDRKPVE